MPKESFSSGLWVFAQSEEKFGGYNRALTVREQLAAAASVPGLKGLELISPLHVSLENATEVKGWLEEFGLEAVSINPYLWTEPQWRHGAPGCSRSCSASTGSGWRGGPSPRPSSRRGGRWRTTAGTVPRGWR